MKLIPLERMDGSPASAENSNGLAHSTATDVQPDIVLALAGRISRMLKGERPDPALSEPRYRAREEKVVAGQTPSDSDRRSRPTDGLQEKSLDKIVGSSCDCAQHRTIREA